jgi:polar amino acid transport system substrate-binding protein
MRSFALIVSGLIAAGSVHAQTVLQAPAGTITAKVDLGAEFPAMAGYVFTQTVTTVPPGTGRALHSHAHFPEIVRIVSGTLTDTREGQASHAYGPGETIINAGGISHSWVNLGSVPVVYIATAIRSAASPLAPAAAADLAPTGRLSVAINLGNAVLAARDAKTGALSGVSVDLARALGARLGVPVDLVPFVSAGETFDAVGKWSLGFLAIDPQRAEKIAFSKPYLVIEGTYVVRADAPFHDPAELDRPGVRIAVARGSAYDLYLSRTLKNATLVRTVTTAEAIELFQHDHLDAAAGIRQALTPAAAGLIVMPGRFMRIEQAIAVPRGHEAGARFVEAFITQALADGTVGKALAANGQDTALAAH